MTECNHVFIGRADGVHCQKCGMHMSTEEYAKYLAPIEKAKRQPRKKAAKNE